MGESIKILHLAKSMIELAGLTVRDNSNLDGDIEITFIGLRDGEKMYEELQIGNDVTTTAHSQIMRSNEFLLPLIKLEARLSNIDANGVLQLSRLPDESGLAL